jgi:hypothetical protein
VGCLGSTNNLRSANPQILLSMNTNAGLNCGGPPSLGMILMQSLFIPVSVLITERLRVEAGRRDFKHFLDGHALERGRAFTDWSRDRRCDSGRPDGKSQRNGSNRHSRFAHVVCPVRRLWRSDGCPPHEAASFSASNLPVKKDATRISRCRRRSGKHRTNLLRWSRDQEHRLSFFA